MSELCSVGSQIRRHAGIRTARRHKSNNSLWLCIRNPWARAMISARSKSRRPPARLARGSNKTSSGTTARSLRLYSWLLAWHHGISRRSQPFPSRHVRPRNVPLPGVLDALRGPIVTTQASPRRALQSAQQNSGCNRSPNRWRKAGITHVRPKIWTTFRMWTTAT